jgi:glycosyltransferase involved in cell wall biosynthesis
LTKSLFGKMQWQTKGITYRLNGMNESTLPKLLVVMPAHNEAGRIGQVIREIKSALPGADIVVIDDTSMDNTAEEALKAGADVLPHAVNMGYGVSLETAYLYAMRAGYNIVVQMDSDGQHLAREIPLLLEPFNNGKADMVVGSRYGAMGGTITVPFLRKAGHRFFAVLLFILTRRWFSDPTSGFQALNGRALTLLASGVFPCDYPDADVLLMAHLSGLRIAEVPVRMSNREGGVSMHSGWKPIYYGIKMLLSVFVVMLNAPVWRVWEKRLKSL